LLGIHYSHSGLSLEGDKIWLEDRGLKIVPEEILAGPRVGVDYAGEDAKRPNRFRITGR
jgi:DNA-3-methyladenine glycosylase